MQALLKFSAVVDWANEKIGVVCNWLVLWSCIISGGNAMVRYAYDQSSNAWLEVQWYMFAVIVMFGASYTLKRNEHVRVDLFYMTLGRRGLPYVYLGYWIADSSKMAYKRAFRPLEFFGPDGWTELPTL